eukprot:g15690.t1
MAGQAAKKAERAREQASNLYYPIIFAANVIFFLFRVVYNYKTFGRRQAAILVVMSLAYYVCYHGLISSAQAGVPGGVYFDILCVCLAGQFVTIFSDFYGMLVFMLVPVYYLSSAGYWVLGKLGGWMRSQQVANSAKTQHFLRPDD